MLETYTRNCPALSTQVKLKTSIHQKITTLLFRKCLCQRLEMINNLSDQNEIRVNEVTDERK